MRRENYYCKSKRFHYSLYLKSHFSFDEVKSCDFFLSSLFFLKYCSHFGSVMSEGIWLYDFVIESRRRLFYPTLQAMKPRPGGKK